MGAQMCAQTVMLVPGLLLPLHMGNPIEHLNTAQHFKMQQAGQAHACARLWVPGMHRAILHFSDTGLDAATASHHMPGHY